MVGFDQETVTIIVLVAVGLFVVGIFAFFLYAQFASSDDTSEHKIVTGIMDNDLSPDEVSFAIDGTKYSVHSATLLAESRESRHHTLSYRGNTQGWHAVRRMLYRDHATNHLFLVQLRHHPRERREVFTDLIRSAGELGTTLHSLFPDRYEELMTRDYDFPVYYREYA